MSAEADTGAIIPLLVEKLATLAEKKINLVRHFKGDLKKLEKSLNTVQAFLHDAEKKKVTSSSVKDWLGKLEDLAFDADNVMDEIEYELLSKKVGATRNKRVKKKVQSFFCASDNNLIAYHLKLGSRIKVVNERLEKINQSATAYGLQTFSAQDPIFSGPDHASASMETGSFSTDPVFLGRENEFSPIVEMLIHTSQSKQVLSVLPIVGMGGLGKTTLARKVFDDKQIKSHFGDNRVWVYVSGNFDVRNILRNILTSLTAEKFELETQQDILIKLQEHMGAKKYLLVLDDVWNKDREVWDDFVNSLWGVSSANGYCMIVTTRSEEVASIVNTLPTHRLRALSDDKCWSIIKAQAFRGGDNRFDVEEIGKNIAKKCQGLPLAAKVVGGLLWSMKSKHEWKSIEENWLSGDENSISNVIKQIFDHLSSPSLKMCFAYCSIFPKGYEIQKEELVELWMAEGFLQTNDQQVNNNIDMETTGSRNFNILLRNSLLQQVRSDGYGNVTHCTMHELTHDLACSILCEGVRKILYIGYKPDGYGLLSIPRGQERYVRTLFFDRKVSSINFFDDFESLNTLTLVGYDINDLPTSIKKLKHLRYLDISKTRIKSLPESIGELYHLQTFRSAKKEYTWDQSYLEKLPDSLRCLIRLRHLHISDKTTLPPDIGRLTSLQTLPHFDVGSKKGCGISELGKLKDLRGELEIRNLENVREKNEAVSADLIGKSGIDKIKLKWDRSTAGDEANDEGVLEGLRPHPNLKSLEICGFEGKSLPSWTLKMAVELDGWEGLNSLVEIKLKDCSECEEVPMLGQLQNLKYLYLSGLRNVKSITPSFYGIDNCTIVAAFRGLKKLKLVDMPNLEDWDEVGEVVVFPCLQYLKIKGCKQLKSAPSYFPCLNVLKIHGMESSLPLANICGRKLTTLTHLKIHEIKELECLPDGLFSNNHYLSTLEIRDCPKMTHLVPLLRLGMTSFLKELQIVDCLSLIELPGDLHTLNSLEILRINGCRDLKSIPYPSSRGGGHGSQQQQGFTSLGELRIEDCKGLTNLPIEMVESCTLSLETLSLSFSSSLKNLFEVIGCLHKMTRLTSSHIYIYGVPEFSVTYIGKYLKMGPSTSDSNSDSSWNNISFNEVVGAMLLQPFQMSTTLQRLRLCGMEDWECLPDQLQHLTSLEILELFNFGIEALPEWFGNISSLETLELNNCRRLRHLPSKQAVQRLSKLTSLWFYGCPLLLKEGRSNDEGLQMVDSEWPKISHIPTILMGY